MSYQENYRTRVTFPRNDVRLPGTANSRFDHNFLESGLFSDERLARLIKNYPREYYTFTTMSARGSEPEWYHGGFGTLSGSFILEAIRKGRFWLSLRRLDLNAPEYNDITEQGLDRLDSLNPDLKSSRHASSILISSPGARVLYHADVSMVALWHIRGKKRIWLYDADNSSHLPDRILERIILRETEEEIPYNPDWDRDAEAITLRPGNGVSWPHNAPHRVDNLEGLNVSVSSDYFTPPSIRRYGVIYTNGILRRKLGWVPGAIRDHGPVALAKCAAAVVIKKSGLVPVREREMIMTFRLDPDRPGHIIKIPPREQAPILQS